MVVMNYVILNSSSLTPLPHFIPDNSAFVAVSDPQRISLLAMKSRL